MATNKWTSSDKDMCGSANVCDRTFGFVCHKKRPKKRPPQRANIFSFFKFLHIMLSVVPYNFILFLESSYESLASISLIAAASPLRSSPLDLPPAAAPSPALRCVFFHSGRSRRNNPYQEGDKSYLSALRAVFPLDLIPLLSTRRTGTTL